MLSLNVIGLFALQVAFQIIGISLLAPSQGFTQPWYSIGVVGSFAVALFAIARILQSGVDLGLILPAAAVVVPLAAIPIGIFFHGETPSVMRIGILVFACILVGVSSKIA